MAYITNSEANLLHLVDKNGLSDFWGYIKTGDAKAFAKWKESAPANSGFQLNDVIYVVLNGRVVTLQAANQKLAKSNY